MKQIIVIRRDLGMRRGKEIAQGAHAAMAFLTKAIDRYGNLTRSLTRKELKWINGPFTKVVLQVPDWESLISVFDKAQLNGIEVHMIIDNGVTEFNGSPTATALAIGPDEDDVLDPLFGGLKLY